MHIKLILNFDNGLGCLPLEKDALNPLPLMLPSEVNCRNMASPVECKEPGSCRPQTLAISGDKLVSP